MAGGVILTAAALLDDRLRAFNTDDGKFLWTASPGWRLLGCILRALRVYLTQLIL
jgi:glucose dehydrogenase